VDDLYLIGLFAHCHSFSRIEHEVAA